MKLATRKTDSRDGELLIVSADGRLCITAAPFALTLQDALDRWPAVEPKLRELSEGLSAGRVAGESIDFNALHSPLPRAYEWVDGSAYINHVVLVRKARGAQPPETLRTDPLVYQGGSGALLGPRDPITIKDLSWGLDLEAEVCVVLADTPQGTSAKDAEKYVRLLMLANDVTLRGLVPTELAKGFGFFQSKPATAFSPFAITPDELGPLWKDGRLHVQMQVHQNGTLVGDPFAGPEMHFSFFDLIAHMTKTRAFTAGTIVGSGTVSNENAARGYSCIAEVRAREAIEFGTPKTPFLKIGDEVSIGAVDSQGRDLFGVIHQKVVQG